MLPFIQKRGAPFSRGKNTTCTFILKGFYAFVLEFKKQHCFALKLARPLLPVDLGETKRGRENYYFSFIFVPL